MILIDFSYRYAALDLVLWLFVIQIQSGVFLGAYAMSQTLVWGENIVLLSGFLCVLFAAALKTYYIKSAI